MVGGAEQRGRKIRDGVRRRDKVEETERTSHKEVELRQLRADSQSCESRGVGAAALKEVGRWKGAKPKKPSPILYSATNFICLRQTEVFTTFNECLSQCVTALCL